MEPTTECVYVYTLCLQFICVLQSDSCIVKVRYQHKNGIRVKPDPPFLQEELGGMRILVPVLGMKEIAQCFDVPFNAIHDCNT